MNSFTDVLLGTARHFAPRSPAVNSGSIQAIDAGSTP
ncbi:Uncharacterised protein [Mycobacteroides abscessus subsp. abscessus]|nr:Uncharacterised protein [Mycobacteroides abscessus subsp. abscessus]SIL20067.1 Uncharacterised protein [Mycobacteroides abscessus subsp. abscessus]SKS19658.1 Uncharacterised protein [Mycobacteroides abscessus subsp. abscessus]